MDTKEIQIREFGKKSGKSPSEIEMAVSKYRNSKQQGPGKDISEAFTGGVQYFKEGVEQAKQAKTPLGKTEAGLKQGAGLIGAAFSPLAPVTKYIGQGIQGAGEAIADVGGEGYEKFAMSKAGQTTARVAEDVQNTAALLSLRGVGKVPTAAKSVGGAISETTKPIRTVAGGIKKNVGGALEDIKPEANSVINHEVSKALNLTPSDMSNFYSKMDNIDVGRFMADNNLLGPNIETTIQNLKNFKESNYNAVRQEIANVPKAYKISQVPRYYDALKQVDEQVGNVKGMEKIAVEVENMMKKEVVTLEDVQRVKELLDDNFQLFKVTGDVKEASTKQGVANMRFELKDFIENQVRENNGTDIAQMNRNVMGARALLDANELRTPRGLKSYQLGMGDWAVFGFGSVAGGGFNPVVGIAALFVKKALETPSVRLRIAKLVDGWSDAQKLKAKAELESGVIPSEFRKVIKIKHNGQVLPPD